MADFSLEDLDDILGDLNDSLADLESEFSSIQPTDDELQKHGLPKRSSTKIEIEDVDVAAMLKEIQAAPASNDRLSVGNSAAIKKPAPASLYTPAPATSVVLPVPQPSYSPPPQPPAELGSGNDDIMAMLTKATSAIESMDPNEQQKIKDKKIQEAMQRLKEANIKKLNLKICINDYKSFKTVVVTSIMSTDAVIAETLEKAHLDAHPDWTLFEVVLDFGIERPMKQYEKVTDVVYTWEMETTNVVMMRQFPGKRQLNVVKTTQEFPRMQGVMFLEKKGKWTKRYFELKFSGVYHYKDTKLSQETFFCSWINVDVYDVIVPRKKAPSKFCFALKSQERIAKTEDPSDHVHFLCVESEEIMQQWTNSIRNAKNRKFLEDHPEYLPDANALKVSAEREVLSSLREGITKTSKVDKKEGSAAAAEEEKARKAEEDVYNRPKSPPQQQHEQQPVQPNLARRMSGPAPLIALPTPSIPPPTLPPPGYAANSFQPVAVPPTIPPQNVKPTFASLPPTSAGPPSRLPPTAAPVPVFEQAPPIAAQRFPPQAQAELPTAAPRLPAQPPPMKRQSSQPNIGLPPLPTAPPPATAPPLVRRKSMTDSGELPLPSAAPPPVPPTSRKPVPSIVGQPLPPQVVPPAKPVSPFAVPAQDPTPIRPAPQSAFAPPRIASPPSVAPQPVSPFAPAAQPTRAPAPAPPPISSKPKTPPPGAGFGQVALPANLPPPPANNYANLPPPLFSSLPPPPSFADLPPPPADLPKPVARKPAPGAPPMAKPNDDELAARMKKIAAKNYVA